jgi:Ca2+-binding EF-hand superfamily protein
LNNFLVGFAELMGAEAPDEKALNMTFKILDENEDGKISFNEMAEVLESLIKIVLGEFDQEYQTMQYQELLE